MPLNFVSHVCGSPQPSEIPEPADPCIVSYISG
jgi:hypothetical protein